MQWPFFNRKGFVLLQRSSCISKLLLFKVENGAMVWPGFVKILYVQSLLHLTADIGLNISLRHDTNQICLTPQPWNPIIGRSLSAVYDARINDSQGLPNACGAIIDSFITVWETRARGKQFASHYRKWKTPTCVICHFVMNWFHLARIFRSDVRHLHVFPVHRQRKTLFTALIMSQNLSFRWFFGLVLVPDRACALWYSFRRRSAWSFSLLIFRFMSGVRCALLVWCHFKNFWRFSVFHRACFSCDGDLKLGCDNYANLWWLFHRPFVLQSRFM